MHCSIVSDHSYIVNIVSIVCDLLVYKGIENKKWMEFEWIHVFILLVITYHHYHIYMCVCKSHM